MSENFEVQESGDIKSNHGQNPNQLMIHGLCYGVHWKSRGATHAPNNNGLATA